MRDLLAFHRPPDNPSSARLTPLLLSANDLVELLALGLRTIRRMDSKGDLPGRVVIGKSVRYQADVIREWTQAGCPPRREWLALQSKRNSKN